MNGAAQLIDDEDNASQRERYTSSSLAKGRSVRSVVATLVACVAVYLGTSIVRGAAPPQNASGRSSEPVSGAPIVTAEPERVPLTDGSGSTEIQWDTGNGAPGFVFVTEDGGKPVPFAKSPRGSQVAPWIGRHRYIFSCMATISDGRCSRR